MRFELHPDLQRDGIEIGCLSLCRILLINDSQYPWFVLVPERWGVRDTIDLNPADYQQLWEESRIFSLAIMNAFNGDKLNVAALGNMTPQLHIHHIVRYHDDPAWPGPIWGRHPMTPYSEIAIAETKKKLLKALAEL